MSTTTTMTEASLWRETPLIYSSQISARLGCDVYLKLENLQPSQSFKHRGISLFAKHCLHEHGPSVHLVIASGGNAGLALAYAAKNLGVKCTVFIPVAAASVKPVLERENAEVIVGGVAYIEALRAAEVVVAREKNAVMVPAYDDPILWKGHSSMMHEIQRQLPDGIVPDAVFCSVGGAGLIGGVLTGCNGLGWNDVKVVGMETYGANCFHLSMLSNPSFTLGSPVEPPPLPAGVIESTHSSVKLAILPSITSRAASLGASSPALGVVKMALERGNVKCVSVSDEMAMAAGLFFAEEHRFILELACSTTLVPAYSPALFNRILSVPKLTDTRKQMVVFIVCGGVKISLKEMLEYQQIVVGGGQKTAVLVDGVLWEE